MHLFPWEIKRKCIVLTVKKNSFSISISLLAFSPCLSVSVAVIKHFDQKQLEEERLYLAHPPSRSHSITKGTLGGALFLGLLSHTTQDHTKPFLSSYMLGPD